MCFFVHHHVCDFLPGDFFQLLIFLSIDCRDEPDPQHFLWIFFCDAGFFEAL